MFSFHFSVSNFCIGCRSSLRRAVGLRWVFSSGRKARMFWNISVFVEQKLGTVWRFSLARLFCMSVYVWFRYSSPFFCVWKKRQGDTWESGLRTFFLSFFFFLVLFSGGYIGLTVPEWLDECGDVSFRFQPGSHTVWVILACACVRLPPQEKHCVDGREDKCLYTLIFTEIKKKKSRKNLKEWESKVYDVYYI